MQYEVLAELQKYKNKEKLALYPKFFQTEAGQYGEGDKFIGVTVPNSRKVAKKYKDLSLDDVELVLRSPYHEMRLVALLILVAQFERAEAKDRERLYEFYLEHTSFINNWDLVDTTAYAILGEYLQSHPPKILYKFAASKDIWEKRTAMVATLAFIKKGKLTETYKIAEILLHDSHDIVQKAVGWMLKEAGEKNRAKLTTFLKKHASSMPRVALRAALEKFPERERKSFLKK